MPRGDGLIQVLLERRKWCQWVPGRSRSPTTTATTTRSSLRGYVEVEDFLICINFRIGRQLFFLLPVGRAWPDRIHWTHTHRHTHFHILCHAAARVLRDIQRTCVSPPLTPLDGGRKNLAKFSIKVAKNHIRYANKLKNFSTNFWVCAKIFLWPKLIELWLLQKGSEEQGATMISVFRTQLIRLGSQRAVG